MTGGEAASLSFPAVTPGCRAISHAVKREQGDKVKPSNLQEHQGPVFAPASSGNKKPLKLNGFAYDRAEVDLSPRGKWDGIPTERRVVVVPDWTPSRCASYYSAMPYRYPVFDVVLKARRRTWVWSVCTPEGDVVMQGSDTSRRAAKYKADRALFLLLLSAPYRSLPLNAHPQPRTQSRAG